MHLLANGCSNTHGAETHNVGISEENRNLAYPRYIADYFSMSYKNIAQPGASNEYIAHTTIKWIEEYNGKLDELFVVIGFTTSVRKSLINENGNFYWNTLHKDPGKIWGTKQNFCELEDYFNLWLEYDTYPEYYDNICVHYINYIHLYLKNKKIKHFFIDGAGGSFLDSKDHESYHYVKNIKEYSTYNDPSCSIMPFLDMFPRKKFGHMGSEGHKLLADKCIEYITKNDLLA